MSLAPASSRIKAGKTSTSPLALHSENVDASILINALLDTRHQHHYVLR